MRIKLKRGNCSGENLGEPKKVSVDLQNLLLREFSNVVLTKK